MWGTSAPGHELGGLRCLEEATVQATRVTASCQLVLQIRTSTYCGLCVIVKLDSNRTNYGGKSA